MALPLLAPPGLSQDERTKTAIKNFRAGYFDGCRKGQLLAGGTGKYADAFCACALSLLDVEMTATKIEELLKLVEANPSAIRDYAPFQRALLRTQECDAVGSYDKRRPESIAGQAGLSPPRVFEDFSIRLPAGFIALAPQERDGVRIYLFTRFHDDLETSTIIQVSVMPFTGDLAGKSEQALDEAADKYLHQMLAGIRRQREDWTQKPVFAKTDGAQRFKSAEWSGSIKGEQLEGIAYAGIAPGRVFLVGTQDFKRYSATTLPLTQSSIATLTAR